MQMIVFLILFVVQVIKVNNQLISNENSFVVNEFNLLTKIRNETNKKTFQDTSNGLINISTILPELRLYDTTFESHTLSSLFINDYSFDSLLSTKSRLDSTSFIEQVKIIKEDKWFNVKQSYKKDPFKSVLYWKRVTGKDANYILTSEPQCIRQICSVELKYNGTLSKSISGCLSFLIRTHGSPVGQIWILEDYNNNTQKIQLTNKTLRVEHSLKPRIKNLSIETRILFRNPQIDSLVLSNININWKGPCPKHRLIPTPSSNLMTRQSTLEDIFMTITNEEDSNTQITNEKYSTTQQNFIYQSTKIPFNQNKDKKVSFSFLNQRNIRWILFLITFLCFSIVLSSIGYGLWLIRREQYFIWHVTFDSKIQLIARRSIHSSIRSDNNIATISQIASDFHNDDLKKEQAETFTTNSSRSTPISYYTYL